MKVLMNSLLSALLFAGTIIADSPIQTSVVGCNFDAISSNAGFDGKFYGLPDVDTSVYSDADFYVTGYQAGSVITTASDITEINFSVPGGVQTLYGVSVNTSSFAIEYTGYFKGMFFFQLFFRLNLY